MADRKKTFVSKPVYPGGKRALNRFIREHLNYPPAALAAQVEGTVRVRYSVDYRGVVVDTQVKSGIGYGCDEEAERVVRLLRFDVPQDRKRKVRIHQNLDIHFKIDRAARQRPAPSAPAPAGIQYRFRPTAAPAKPESQQPPDKPARTYTYTIRLK
jgi:TonB family protein